MISRACSLHAASKSEKAQASFTSADGSVRVAGAQRPEAIRKKAATGSFFRAASMRRYADCVEGSPAVRGV